MYLVDQVDKVFIFTSFLYVYQYSSLIIGGLSWLLEDRYNSVVKVWIQSMLNL